MHDVIDRLEATATGRRVALAWIAFFGFALGVFPLFDRVNGMPEAVTPLDLRLLYAPTDVAEVLAALGDAGRTAYLRSLLIADIAWPAVYGVTLVLTIAWGWRGTSWQRRLMTLPVLAVVFDLAENTSIAIQIARFPQVTTWLATLSSGVSAIKWLFAGSATVAAVAALVRRGAARRSRG